MFKFCWKHMVFGECGYCKTMQALEDSIKALERRLAAGERILIRRGFFKVGDKWFRRMPYEKK